MAYPIAVRPETLKSEVESAKVLLTELLEDFEKGIPGVDGEAVEDEVTEDFLRKLSGDLRVVANKCEGIANILQGVA